MSTRKAPQAGLPPAKRAKTDTKIIKFTNGADIRAALRPQNIDGWNSALTSIRNQLTLKFDEPPISPQDPRLLLAQEWLGSAAGAHDLFELWEGANQRQYSLLALVVSVFSSLLTLLSSHYTYQTLGQPIIKMLLAPQWMRRLNSYMGTSNTELILVSLKLFNAMSAFASGRERKSVLEAFAWETKSLPKLLTMRRKGRTEDFTETLARPDIRTLYILFIISFLDPHCATQVKTAFLEQHREVFLSIFKGIPQDSYPIIRKLLEVCWAGLWSDQKIKRTLKIGLFGDNTLLQLAKLYERAAPEGSDDDDQIPADLAHHFLLAICTRPGVGVCFRDKGWYPREEADKPVEEEQSVHHKSGGKIHNRILANLLRTLKVNEDSRQQELALKIMTACPELVAGYWSAAALTLEPRLSSKWIANVAFFGAIISLPVPTVSLLLPNTTQHQPTPPPLATILENILPSVGTKNNLSKGLQSSSGLVQHCSALALAKCLIKYEHVLGTFRTIQEALEEDEEDGQWCRRRRELEKEVRRRVPEFQVVVGFSQQKAPVALPDAPPTVLNSTKVALIGESAQRLLWMYHRCLPAVVAEARFDVGKLLQGFLDDGVKMEAEDEEGEETKLSMHNVRQLHVLRLLKESDQFSWSGKLAGLSHSYLYVLLKAHNTTGVPAARHVLTSLLLHILSESIMFQEDPEEVQLWLSAIPSTRRTVGTEAADGTILADEAESVITFLDDCVQRCLKTPYKYIEDLAALAGSSASPTDGRPSPLLMTVVEQLTVKASSKSNLLSPSDVLALMTFVRRLVFRLSTKQPNLSLLKAVAAKLECVEDKALFKGHPVVAGAVRREREILDACLRHEAVEDVMEIDSSEEVKAFIENIEAMPIPESKSARIGSATELVDWVRLVGQPLQVPDVQRLVAVVETLHKPALADFSEMLDPTKHLLWEGFQVLPKFTEYKSQLSFEWLFLQSDSNDLTKTEVREALAEAVSPTLVDLSRAVCLISHSLHASQTTGPRSQDLLLLLAQLMQRAQAVLTPAEVAVFKERVFQQSEVIQKICAAQSLTEEAQQGLETFVKASLDPTSVLDRRLASEFTSQWIGLVKDEPLANLQFALMSLWIQYAAVADLFDLLDSVDTADGMSLNLAQAILSALEIAVASSTTESDVALQRRLGKLLALRPSLPDSVILENMVAKAIEASLPAGHDGFALESSSFEELSSVVERAQSRWSRRQDASNLNAADAQSFLLQTTWTDATAKIVSGLIYRRILPRAVVEAWLVGEHCAAQSTSHFVRVLHSLLDSTAASEQGAPVDGDVLARHVPRIFEGLTKRSSAVEVQVVCGKVLSLMVVCSQADRKEILVAVDRQIQSLSTGILTISLVEAAIFLHHKAHEDAGAVITAVIDHGLQWSVRRLAAEDGARSNPVFKELATLVALAGNVKAHHADSLLASAIQNGFSDSSAIGLASAVAKGSSLKPLIVNRHLQTVLQHRDFFKLCALPGTGASPVRDAVIGFLYTLFYMHPTNTCQPSHVEPLVKVYRGTLSVTDRKILAIFQLFESERKSSISSFLGRWSSSPDSLSPNALEAIQSMDAIRVLRTCLTFPKWRTLDGEISEHDEAFDSQAADPVFIILLFSRMMSEGPPQTAFGWVELFRTNVVSALIRCLSSKDDDLRDAALTQIATLWKVLEYADMQEKPHVGYILSLLKDTLPAPTESAPSRIPSYTSLVIMHALRGIFYPSNFIYPITARFLLQRPEIDTTDVPMLYNMLYSSSDDWKKERGWIIKFLADGMSGSEDWRVFKRRHTWDLLSSLFQSSDGDKAIRNGILDVLANLTCNSQATTSLVLKSALLTWIEMQLPGLKGDEGVAWVRILENILIAVDPVQMEASTNGEWRSIICRCLTLLLTSSASPSSSPSVFVLAAPVILRLGILPGSPIPQLPASMAASLDALIQMESTTSAAASCETVAAPLKLPHTSHGLHDVVQNTESIHLWGASVQALWRIAMTFEQKPETWNALTSRLLVWRSLTGSQRSEVGEWAREEVVGRLQIS